MRSQDFSGEVALQMDSSHLPTNEKAKINISEQLRFKSKAQIMENPNHKSSPPSFSLYIGLYL